jgi:hypothetical protein
MACYVGVARAEDAEGRPPLPEPILNETTTDLDGTDPGEVEIEANTSMLRSRVGRAFDLQLSPEFEMLLTRHLGARVEPFFERTASAGQEPTDSGGISGGLSWKLLQDFKDDFHLQAEIDEARAPRLGEYLRLGELAVRIIGG